MKHEKACPSATCEEGSKVIGVVNEVGTVQFLSSPLPVTKEFIDIASQGRTPEKRFRFTNRCVENGCSQWNGSGCGIIEGVLKTEQQIKIKSKPLPKCGIRTQCRWFHQAGRDACIVCPLVVTDNREAEP
jgi:hypothetical protein